MISWTSPRSIEFSLAAVAAGCHAAFANLAMHKEISFLFMIDEDAKGLYLGDPTRLRQILYNLLSNAMKFTSVGEVSVGVSYVEDRLIIAVKDSGVGMTPEQTERLFRKFAQADASTTRKFGGTGLGLAIVRELALAMGGDVEVRSVLGEGTTLRVSLGLPRVGPEIIETAELESDEGDHDQASYDAINVLVAEDNEINQLVIKTLLNQGGSVPFVVATGKLALEAWETGRWDVILMDVQMPEMDGPTATRLIRERESQTGRRRTPILALTANAMTHQVNEYVAAGMDGHIAKPIEASKLFAALEDVLSGVDFAESDMPSDARLSSQVGT
jgi:CheY-like chemotaxis protein/anti-sigma regulatory factor (Ser/Thr protein kinase)